MTRAQGLRSCKRKPLTSSQDVLEYCKENSPSILSQNSRRAAEAKKKTYDCTENILPKSSKRKSVKSNQVILPEYCKDSSLSILSHNSKRAAEAKKKTDDCTENIVLKGSKTKPVKSSQEYCIIAEYCKENSPSILSQNSRRAVPVKKESDDYKENILPKGSKKKPTKPNQEVIPEYCKENSPSILTQNTRRAAQIKKKSDSCKENILPNSLTSNSKLTPQLIINQQLHSPVRKSRRRPNATELIRSNKAQERRNALNDTTNSLQPVLSRNNVFHKLITVPQLSGSTNNSKTDYDNHIPVYKTICSLKPSNNVQPILEKTEAVYEFEVDENEEPVMKKKRKKRAYVRKPKTGPKALTINNIKYSSTESLASLPEKPITKRKNTFVRPKCNIKPTSSVTTLSDSCVSALSHPPMNSHENRCELSVLQETQSEQCPTPEPTLLEPPVNQSSSSSIAVPLPLSSSHHIHFSQNPRCYGSKSGQTPNPYTDDHNVINGFQVTSCSGATNVSTSSHDFLSSTPCKRFSLVVRNNSVFDDSPGMMRPSTGLVQDASSLTFTDDNCFGFDEPEELEEPLVSPIKSGIDLQPRRMVKYVPKRYDWEEPKPSIQEVIEMLKANIPKPAAKKETTMFETSPQSNEPVSPTLAEDHAPVFVKPARRSYERQRRVHYYNSDSEEEEETREEIKSDTTSIKEDKKCYKKANTTKTVRAPKITKAKQRIAKEEEELEKMAAMMNAQFQEIDKVDLVVE